MVSVDLWLRAKRVMVVFNDTPMEEGSGVFFLTAHFVIPVISLTSSSLCPHSLRHPCVLTHFVIPVFSHPSLVFSPISSLSLTSLSSHLTQVIPDYSLSHHSCYHSSHTQCSHTHPHSSHSPRHLIVIPGYSLPSLVLPLTHTSVLTLSVLTPIVIPDYSLPSLVLPCSLIPAFSLTSLL